jgi:hypothetical protein
VRERNIIIHVEGVLWRIDVLGGSEVIIPAEGVEQQRRNLYAQRLVGGLGASEEKPTIFRRR